MCLHNGLSSASAQRQAIIQSSAGALLLDPFL